MTHVIDADLLIYSPADPCIDPRALHHYFIHHFKSSELLKVPERVLRLSRVCSVSSEPTCNMSVVSSSPDTLFIIIVVNI